MNKKEFLITSLTILLLIIGIRGLSQGVKPVPEKEYNNLASPSIEAGAGVAMNQHEIPEQLFPIPGNQGNDNSCVGWAIGYAYMSYLQRHIKPTSEVRVDNLVFSPWYLYKAVKQCSDCKCGIRTDFALDYLKKNGNVLLKSYPYVKDDCEPPTESLKPLASQYRIKNWKRTEDILNLSEIKKYIVNNIPVIIIVKADEAFKKYKDPKGGHPYEWQNSFDYEYHAAVAVGFNDAKRSFKILNSYGSSWGTQGYAWVTYESFRQMCKEAYIILPDNNNLTYAATVTIKDSSKKAGAAPVNTPKAEDFTIHGRKEQIRKNRYHFGYYLTAKPEILTQVKKVVYHYDDPSFIYKYVTSVEPPNFPNSYEGWGCLEKMRASIMLSDSSIIEKDFSGCTIDTNVIEKLDVDPKFLNITAHVSAKAISYRNYRFNIDLRGLEPFKPQIDSVVYYWNHPTFIPPSSKARAENNYSNGYKGWGCLSTMRVIIYFNNGKQKVINVDMCNQLGWTDR